METVEALLAEGIKPETYQAFLDTGFRRSGRMIYRPACVGCSACVSIRVPVATFKPSDSQRRSVRRNLDLVISVAEPESTDEKFDLYARYVRQWHRREQDATRDALADFLYESPTTTLEFTYRTPAGKLIGVGICDVGQRMLSSVYFYFDPDEARRGLGTYSAVYEIDFANRNKIEFYYLGYWVSGCRAMEYKAAFGPHEKLCDDGVWRAGS